ncbi:HugZ family protein [Phaeobacter sp. HF9A]|uniref:HugZ family pyridoxamine 5'-phosphate oxidase n=1 Tax=Phaeobacter sp. HF9A TaxID=2721561 RepID=UPI001430050D|nr:pyridoxamine 5'-phosphate oxidase family protein [Phaeobacter sp. HF9A]NIZ13966.1 pyridoxamine 5-phosphate oxidase [Phaeobacter sp. HF9A]
MAVNPLRPTDDAARALAREVMQGARFAALATLTEAGHPMQSRVAFALDATGAPISLVSTLAPHTQALQHRPQVSLLVGEPGEKGDPLTHPRLSLNGVAMILPNTGPAHEEMAAHYLRSHPKAKLYIGFGDFHFIRFQITQGFLNAGFGKAFQLSAADLGLAP